MRLEHHLVHILLLLLLDVYQGIPCFLRYESKPKLEGKQCGPIYVLRISAIIVVACTGSRTKTSARGK